MHKFLNREATYSELLMSIANYERRLALIRKETKELNTEYRALKSEVDFIDVKVPTEKAKYVQLKL